MIYEFAECRLDAAAHRLMRSGEEVRVEPQVFDLIALLLRAAPALVTYDEMIAEIWDGRIVSDATLAARISAARTALGDDGKRQAVIRTHPRRGVQMVPPVRVADGTVAPGRGDLAQDIRITTAHDGTALAWSSLGEGPPLLRAGHWLTHLSLDLQSPIWRPWIDRLRAGRRLIRYDPRGTGMSDRDCGEVSLEAWVSDLGSVADAAGLDRFAIFCASQSAAVAIRYIVENPGRISRMVIYGGFPQGSMVRDRADGAAMTGAMAKMIRDGWGRPDSGYMHALSALFMPRADPALVHSFIEMQIASATPERASEIREVSARCDVVDLLPQVDVPVLVAHAGDDTLHPFSQATLLASRIPDARLLRLDTTNHVLVPDEPAFAELMDEVDRFLAEAD
ncbi:hypothetical protein HKCCE3408_18410 [Rhodobacterales bacterium HKCCE3408]|nr:hypothetical protein [Rhodobacterales bacterium HKCCE3408]